jgi:hypothetical protein
VAWIAAMPRAGVQGRRLHALMRARRSFSASNSAEQTPLVTSGGESANQTSATAA